jgi:hypothetical protein
VISQESVSKSLTTANVKPLFATCGSVYVLKDPSGNFTFAKYFSDASGIILKAPIPLYDALNSATSLPLLSTMFPETFAP